MARMTVIQIKAQGCPGDQPYTYLISDLDANPILMHPQDQFTTPLKITGTMGHRCIW